MKNKSNESSVITPFSDFLQFEPNYPYTEVCETDRLCIPIKKPDIKEILQVSVSISVCSNKTICTPIGKKLVINGTKNVKIMYIANNSCQSVHSAHFELPFCSFISLKHWCYKIIDICKCIEHVCAYQLNSRCLSFSSIIFMCPIFKKKYNSSNHCKKKHQCNEADMSKNLDICDIDSNEKHSTFCCEEDKPYRHDYHDNKYDYCYNEDPCKPHNDSYYFSNCYEEECPQTKDYLDEDNY